MRALYPLNHKSLCRRWMPCRTVCMSMLCSIIILFSPVSSVGLQQSQPSCKYLWWVYASFILVLVMKVRAGFRLLVFESWGDSRDNNCSFCKELAWYDSYEPEQELVYSPQDHGRLEHRILTSSFCLKLHNIILAWPLSLSLHHETFAGIVPSESYGENIFLMCDSVNCYWF